MAKQYIAMVDRYVPDGENNCLTYDEVVTAMQKANQILNICTDLNTLPETELP